MTNESDINIRAGINTKLMLCLKDCTPDGKAF
jgi:hypothetical protein